MLNIILDSLIVTFLSLLFISAGLAVFVGYLIHKASELGGPGFLSDDRSEQEHVLPTFAAESATEIGQEAPKSASTVTWDFDGRSSNSVEIPLEGRGAPGRPSLTRSPCQFCQRVRERVVNAWNTM